MALATASAHAQNTGAVPQPQPAVQPAQQVPQQHATQPRATAHGNNPALQAPAEDQVPSALPARQLSPATLPAVPETAASRAQAQHPPGDATPTADSEAGAGLDTAADARLGGLEPPQQADFRRSDRNGDGFVALVEIEAPSQRLEAQQFDADNDQRLDAAEYRMFRNGTFAALDADQNGFLSRVEVARLTPAEQRFAVIDTDGDQRLSRSEYQAFVRAGDWASGNAVAFESLDRNGDGLIDRIEASAHAALAEQFATLDGNGDGRVERDQYALFLEQLDPQRGPATVRIEREVGNGLSGQDQSADASADDRFD